MDVLVVHHSPNFWPGLLEWESYCDFDVEDMKEGKLCCTCGETSQNFKWNWEPNSVGTQLSKTNREVIFHPVYSPGTAAVRGSHILENNAHHYWEIKILTKLYGTDVMIGVGTSDVALEERQYKFCSMLGYDNKSWGYSYRGAIQHDKLAREYGPPFGVGSIVGIHLDMYSGTLEYYMNRKPLGIAFKGLKGKELYPMVCSTAAQSSVRLITSYSFHNTLEMCCLKVIQNNSQLTKQFYSIPGLSRMIKSDYYWRLPSLQKLQDDQPTLSLEDEAVLPFTTMKRLRKRPRPLKWSSDLVADPDHISHREYLRRVNTTTRAKKYDPYKSPSCVRCILRDSRNARSFVGKEECDRKADRALENASTSDSDVYGDLESL